MRRVKFLKSLLAVCAVLAIGRAAWAQHAGDFIIGITGPTVETADTLAFEIDPDELNVVLSPVSGLLNGWTSTEPGFDHLEENEPIELFFVLGSGADVRLEIVSIDNGLKIWQSGFGAMADAVGESIILGGSELHSHATWHIDSNVLGSGWTGTLSATFKLIDTGSTGYNDSDPFTMTFTNVPEPASLILAGLGGGMMLLARRRRLNA